MTTLQFWGGPLDGKILETDAPPESTNVLTHLEQDMMAAFLYRLVWKRRGYGVYYLGDVQSCNNDSTQQ